MNRRTSRSVWLLLFILALGGGPRSFGAVPDPALVNFQSWAKSYVTASTTVRPGLEAEGLKLATARQPVFQPWPSLKKPRASTWLRTKPSLCAGRSAGASARRAAIRAASRCG